MTTQTLYRLALGALICAACALLPAAGAGAATPPGDSSIDQYLPSVPGAGGDQSVDEDDGGDSGNGGGGSDDGGGGSSLPPDTEAELEAQGPEGAAVAGLVEETAPAPSTSGGSGSETGAQGGGEQGDGGGGGASDDGGAGGEAGASAKSASDETESDSSGFFSKLGKLVSASVASEGGMGVGLPIILVASLIAALAVLVLRRRGAGTGE